MVNEYVDNNIERRGSSELCPVVTLQRYLHIVKINGNSKELIFRSITSHKNHRHRTLRMENIPLSYARLRKLFLDAETTACIEREELSLHSLRSGGVSAAGNAGVNDRLFKIHGCWHSESAKDGYIDDNIEASHPATRRCGSVITTSLCTSQRRRRYVSNETTNDVSVERRQDVSVVRLHNVLLVCCDYVSRERNDDVPSVRLHDVSNKSEMKHPMTSQWYVTRTSQWYVSTMSHWYVSTTSPVTPKRNTQ